MPGTAFTDDLLLSLQRNLEAFSRNPIQDGELRRAAVCIAICADPAHDRACFLLTRRQKSMSRHSGQYALPGGRLDEGETVEAAAIREMEEELGIPRVATRLVGVLDDYATRSGFCITPVVAWIGGAVEIRADAAEVAAFFRVPLDDLLQSHVPRTRRIAQSDRPVLSIEFASLGHEVFAPTAAMLYQFREVGLLGRSTRVAHYEQPVFAWR